MRSLLSSPVSQKKYIDIVKYFAFIQMNIVYIPHSTQHDFNSVSLGRLCLIFRAEIHSFYNDIFTLMDAIFLAAFVTRLHNKSCQQFVTSWLGLSISISCLGDKTHQGQDQHTLLVLYYCHNNGCYFDSLHDHLGNFLFFLPQLCHLHLQNVPLGHFWKKNHLVPLFLFVYLLSHPTLTYTF